MNDTEDGEVNRQRFEHDLWDLVVHWREVASALDDDRQRTLEQSARDLEKKLQSHGQFSSFQEAEKAVRNDV